MILGPTRRKQIYTLTKEGAPATLDYWMENDNLCVHPQDLTEEQMKTICIENVKQSDPNLIRTTMSGKITTNEDLITHIEIGSSKGEGMLRALQREHAEVEAALYAGNFDVRDQDPSLSVNELAFDF